MDLLERERSLADLTDWLRSAGQTGGGIALLGGEAGIGKTTVLQEFARQQTSVRVLWGACDALYTPRPLAPLHDIARQTGGALAAAIASGGDAAAIFAAAYNELAAEHALVVFEDMHWADEATLDLFKFLGRRIHQTRALLVASYRDDELDRAHPLRVVIGELPHACTRRLLLAPLSEGAVAQLARRAGRPPEGLHGITGGNPLFVTEALAAPAESIPGTVRDAVLARAARLPPAARAVAELACVVPGKTEAWLLGQTTHPDEAALEACLRIGMVRGKDASLAFRHELARLALEDTLSQARREELHARVLTALEDRGEIAAARLAHHADGARNSEKVLFYSSAAAAQAAAVGAHREAAAHYQLALAYSESRAAEDRAHLLEKLMQECFLTGQQQRALDAERAALEIWRDLKRPAREGEAMRWLGRISWYLGDGAEARRWMAAAIETLSQLPPGAELAAAYVSQAHLDMEAHELDSSIAWAQRAIALAEPLQNTCILTHALNILGLARLIGGEVAGWADLKRSLQLALAGALQEEVGGAYTSLAAMAVSRREYLEAASYLSAGLQYCEEHDLDYCLPYMLAYRARLRFEQGDWNGASQDIEAVLRHPRTAPPARIPALRTLAHLRVRRGDPGVQAAVDEVRALADRNQELQQAGMLAVVCAEARWLAGDRDGVIREIQAVYARAQSRRDPRMNGELAAWLWRVDALEEPPADIAEPYATEMCGSWRAAARAWQGFGCAYEQACLLGWHGDEADQRQALATFDQLGAKPAAQALRRKMRLQGVRRIPRGARSSTSGNAFGLTRREAQILELLAEGLRNATIAKRLFLSSKTVEHHISAVLAKLGVSSRAEAVVLARNNGATKQT
jgi:DNA-binding CsgD family transcriptional regulator